MSHDTYLDAMTKGDSSRGLAVALPTLGIIGSEFFVYTGNLEYALWGYLITLLVCVLAPLQFTEDIHIFQAFVLLPTFRLVNLGMPVFVELTLYWLPLVYGSLVPAALYLAKKSPVVDIGIAPKRTVLLLPVLLVLGVAFAEAEYRILDPQLLLPEWTPLGLVVLAVVMVFFVALAEELLFRVLLQGTLEAKIGRIPGLVVASIAFAATHSGYQLPAEVGFAFVLALVLGMLYDWTESLVAVTIVHGVTNTLLFGFFPWYGSVLVRGL